MRILLADNDPMVRDHIRLMAAETFVTNEIVESAGFPALLVALAIKPELLIIDLTLPGFEWQIDLQPLCVSQPDTAVVVLTDLPDVRHTDSLLNAGVRGIISKATPPESIQFALASIVGGDIVVYPPQNAEIDNPNSSIDAMFNRLSTRQRDVLRGVCKGQSNKEIARELNLSPYTVRLHVSAILQTLGVTSRTAAASFALSNGFHGISQL